MTTVVDLQNAIADYIRAQFPALVSVETTKGARVFNAAIIDNSGGGANKGLGMRLPAAIVAPVSIGWGGQAGGRGGPSAAVSTRQLDANINFAVYFFFSGVDREDAALLTAQQFISGLLYNQWGLPMVSVPVMTSIAAVPGNVPLFTKLGVAVWGVTWWQALRIGMTREEYEIEFTKLNVGSGEAVEFDLDVKAQPGSVGGP